MRPGLEAMRVLPAEAGMAAEARQAAGLVYIVDYKDLFKKLVNEKVTRNNLNVTSWFWINTRILRTNFQRVSIKKMWIYI